MHVRRHVSLIETPLRPFASRPLLSQCRRCRRYASSAYPENIAILGGGITGLASAHFISKEFPKSKITVYEAGKDTGGWVKSKKVEVAGGEVLFEYGPRTLRPGIGALPTVQLIEDLDLTSEVLYTPKDSPGAKNRYIYYPDRLNRLPSSVEDLSLANGISLWNSGILDGLWNVFMEPFQNKRPRTRQDESIGSLISRRVDPRLANNILSAVMHGVYAGDVYQLSAKTLLSTAWHLEGKYGSILWGMVRMNQDDQRDLPLVPWHPWDWDQYREMKEHCTVNDEFIKQLVPRKTSTFTFKDGMQSLVKKLEANLKESGTTEFLTDTRVEKYVKVPGSDQIELTTTNPSSPPRKFDFVVSTLPSPSLADSVNVMVVNLFYHNPGLVAQRGFGYLIPRSVPFEQNPERALGIIFDHDAIQGQDSVEGTKLTVMLGGHWWDGWEGFPDSEEGKAMALSVLRRHLGIQVEPDLCHVTLNRNCIPQYTVGYEDRLASLGTQLLSDFNGRLRVVGSQYNGVGVNDCVRSAWQLARAMKGAGWKSRSAGPAIDRVHDTREWKVEPVLGMRNQEKVLEDRIREKYEQQKK